MENEIDSIDKKIEQLRNVILQKYNEQTSVIEKNINFAKESAIEAVVLNRAALVKELDDRLALIKQFPSVLDADLVTVRQIKELSRIEFRGQDYDFLPVHQGNWKVLILAKRIV